MGGDVPRWEVIAKEGISHPGSALAWQAHRVRQRLPVCMPRPLQRYRGTN